MLKQSFLVLVSTFHASLIPEHVRFAIPDLWLVLKPDFFNPHKTLNNGVELLLSVVIDDISILATWIGMLFKQCRIFRQIAVLPAINKEQIHG